MLLSDFLASQEVKKEDFQEDYYHIPRSHYGDRYHSNTKHHPSQSCNKDDADEMDGVQFPEKLHAGREALLRDRMRCHADRNDFYQAASDTLDISSFTEVPPETELKLNDDRAATSDVTPGGYYGLGSSPSLFNFGGLSTIHNQSYLASHPYSFVNCTNNNLPTYTANQAELTSLHNRHILPSGACGGTSLPGCRSPASNCGLNATSNSGPSGMGHNLKNNVFGTEIRDCLDSRSDVNSSEDMVNDDDIVRDRDIDLSLMPPLLMQDPPMTSPHVKSLSSLCPPFPEARMSSLSPIDETDHKIKGEGTQF